MSRSFLLTLATLLALLLGAALLGQREAGRASRSEARLAALEAENRTLTEKLAAAEAALAKAAKAEADRSAARAATRVSDAERARWAEPCRLRVAETRGDPDAPAFARDFTAITDAWGKDGRVVFQVTTPAASGSTPALVLCTVDRATGRIELPPGDQDARWQRGP